MTKSPALRRLAAVAALLALAGAVALAFVALLPDVLLLIPGVVAALVAVAALWTALTTRGVVRWGAAALAVAGMAGVVALALAKDAVGPLIGAIILTLASGALADVALPDLPSRHGPRAAAPRRAVFFMNPKSGGGKVGRFGLIEKAEAAGARVILIEHGLDLIGAAEEAAAGGADLLGVAGGDGSQALVAGVAARHDIPFLVVPAGTRNHFALDLGLDREDPSKALDALTDGTERRIDLGLVGDRIFVNNVSFGAYAAIVSEEGYRDAKIRTALGRLPELVGSGASISGLVLRVPGEDPVSDAQVVLVSNNVYGFETGGGGTRERIDAGVLGVVSVRMGGGLDAAGLLLRGPSGLPGWRQVAATQAEVSGPDPTLPAGIDGESIDMPSPVVLKVLPAALRIRLPRHGLKRTGGTRRTALSAVPRLLAMAAGRPDPMGSAA
ncbi:MAG: diacylglycerol kinase [Thermoleophilia bacterium]|nr:diacylglycerol kinase [Thermoleophilia bacterium]